METEYRPESPGSHISFLPDDEIPPPPPATVEMQRRSSAQQMPPWLRQAVADRRRQLIASRELDESPNLTEDHFGIAEDRFDVQHTIVADWLDGLPERLIVGWETVLREEVEETFVKRDSKPSLEIPSRLHLEDECADDGHQCNEYSFIDDEYVQEDDLGDPKNDQEIEDDFLRKVLLGRKRLMQAEISVKRLKMGLKYVASGMCEEFGNATDVQRTRNLLAAVNSTFEEVVRKRLSTATVKGVDPKDDYRVRLADLRESDPTLMSRIYSENEIRELKTMVEDILSMDGRRVDGEGKQWFLTTLPRLLELREDMALAEKEIERSKMLQGREMSSDGSQYDNTAADPSPSDYNRPVSLWDIYYMQYCWIQAAFEYRPKGPWEGFEISLEDEAESEDWQLRIEQRIWLQEQFGLTLGTMPWTPFRQGNPAFCI